MGQSYKDLFFSEAEEYLGKINRYLVTLEKNSNDQQSLVELFRCMHTLKGMAATMNFKDLAELAHKMEDIFGLIKSGKAEVDTDLMDLIFSAVDAFATVLSDLKSQNKPSIQLEDYTQKLDCLFTQNKPGAGSQETKKGQLKLTLDNKQKKVYQQKQKQEHSFFEIKITIAENCPMKEARVFLIIVRLNKMGTVIATAPGQDKLKKGDFASSFLALLATNEDPQIIKKELMQILDVSAVKINPFKAAIKDDAPLTAAPKKKPASSYVKKIQSIRVPIERLDKVMNFVGELAIAKGRLMQIAEHSKLDDLDQVSFQINKLISYLQDEVIEMRFLPISYILDSFPRIVRDLGRKLGKEVDLHIEGGDIELDKIILDKLGDPLIHLIRNAIDHGIETRQQREKKGKPPKGRLSIEVIREKGYVIIEISDDGKGLDLEKIAEKGYQKGLINAEKVKDIDAATALNILTTPGFSTAAEVSDISGRGVGLDVVRAKLDSFGGQLSFDSKLGEGTKFILHLPLTLTIIKAMLIKAGGQIFAIPLMLIGRTAKFRKGEIKTIQGKAAIKDQQDIIPFFDLAAELKMPGKKASMKNIFPVVIVENRTKKAALAVDRIIREQDIVVKPLSILNEKIRGIAGATILGSGEVVLILDVMNLF